MADSPSTDSAAFDAHLPGMLGALAQGEDRALLVEDDFALGLTRGTLIATLRVAEGLAEFVAAATGATPPTNEGRPMSQTARADEPRPMLTRRELEVALAEQERRLCDRVAEVLVDALVAVGTAVGADGNRTRKDIADFRARHGFVGDPKAQSPAVTSGGERMVPRWSPGVDTRLPPGRPHP